jgi:hypothetical protein
MAGLPFGSKDSKGAPAYLRQGGIICFLFRQGHLPFRKIDWFIDFEMVTKTKKF